MIKIGQIIDSETKGLHYLEDYKGKQYVIPQLTMTQSFDVEVIEFDGETPVRFIESKTLVLDLNNLNGKTIREALNRMI